MKKLNTLLTIAALSCSPLAFGESQIYLEDGGLVTFEVEDGDIVDDWVLRTEVEGYMGSGYLKWEGPNYTATSTAGNGAITYHFRIETAGNYEFRWRSYIAEGTDNSEHNDSWLRLATADDVVDEWAIDGWTKIYNNKLNDWGWNSYTKDNDGRKVRQYFEAGDHTLEISGRSGGHAIDRIVLFKYDTHTFHGGQFDALPVSESVMGGTTSTSGGTTDSATDGGATDGGTDTSGGTDTAGDTGGGETGTTDGGTTDGGTADGSTTGGTDNVNADVADSGSEMVSGVCAGNTVFLSPIDDVHVQDGAYHEGGVLEMQPDLSYSLLKFDVSAVTGIMSADLQYSIVSDAGGQGEMSVYLASHDDWPSSDMQATIAPYSSVLLGMASGTWNADTRYQTALAADMVSGRTLSLLVQMETGSDSLSLMSSDATDGAGPRLKVAGGITFCAAYNLAVAQQNAMGTDTGNTDGSTDAGTTDGTTDGMSSSEEPKAGRAESGVRNKVGAFGPWMLLLLTTLGVVIRKQRR